MKKVSVLLAAAMFLALPMVASAAIVGDCVDCHTMHNSEQGQKVAVVGTAGTLAGTANANLLRMDCLACHAQDIAGTDNVVTATGGSKIPQVYHNAATDLAAGNFRYVAASERKGHNVVDMLAADGANAYAAPGDVRSHNFGAGTASTAFTCAGAVGCHGTRSQLLSGYTNDNGTVSDTADDSFVAVKRQGLAAVSGAHHNNPADQDKSAALQNVLGKHDGAKVAAGYRFIPGLKGLGNEVDAWQNVNAGSHNEYFGVAGGIGNNSCDTCHVASMDPGAAGYIAGSSSRMAVDSTLLVPSQSMSGFCSTCHGNFHSSGVGNDYFKTNGVSGAFLRHPSDYVIPNTGEYAAYTTYNVTAPVARPVLPAAVSGTVAPGTDMVMCLSCHMAHGSDHEGMLRFDYDLMTAGGFADTATAQAAGGCMACHTTKGVLK